MPDINYRLNIDTTQLANSMSEIRSQLNTGVSSGFGYMDTGRAALGGLSDFGGAAAAGGGAMVSGMRSMPMPTFVHMDQGISFTPHYGVVNAQASLQAEWLGRFYGPAGVAPFTPPGVAPTQYFGFLAREHERKFAEAKTDALIAGGGAVAGYVGGDIGAMVGGAIGSAIMPGIGTLGGGLLGAIVGNKVTDMGVDVVKRQRAMTSELGSIIDAHRMLPEGTQRELAAAALEGGREIGMNPQETADIVARMSKLGTLIPTTDPDDFKAQLKSVASDIQDFASALHVATGAAQEMMRTMERYGHRGVEGADWLISQAGRIGMGITPTQVYGLATGGAAMTRNAQIGGGFGFQLMPDLAAEATHAGLGREGMQMAGGISGFAGALASNVLGNAFSPMGMLQIAAAPGRGFALPGSLEETLDKGINNIMGDFPRRFLALEVGRGEAIRQMGPGRTTDMAKQNLRNTVDLLAPLFGPNVSESDRELLGRHFLMQQGMNEYQAKGAAYRYLNSGAKDVENMGANRYLQEIRRNREIDHAARAGSEAMEMDSDFFGIPIAEHGGLAIKHGLESLGSGMSVREGREIEAGTRERYRKYGVPLDSDPQTMADVESGVIGARGVRSPLARSFVGGEMGKVAAIMGGDSTNVGDMLKRSNALQAATAGFTGDARDLVLGRTGQHVARIFHDEIIKDEAGFKKRLQDLADALPGNDPKSVHERLLAVVKGTEYEAEIRRTGGLGKYAGEALPLIMAYAKTAGTRGDLGLLGLGEAAPENIKKWIASEHDAGVKKVSDGDKLKELSDVLILASKRSKVESREAPKIAGDDGSSAALGGLAGLIARQNQVLDGIVQEQRRMRSGGHGAHKNKTYAGSN